MILGQLPTCCTVQGCTKALSARDMCAAHYQRWKSTGDPLTPTPTERRHQDADEILWLLSCGESIEQALHRVTGGSWTPRTAYRWALRNHRDDLRAAVCHAASIAYRRKKEPA